MKLETDGYKYLGTDNQKLPVSHSTKSIPRHFIFTFPLVKAWLRRFPRFPEKRKKRQGASARLTSSCLATKSKSGGKWQQVLCCKVQCLALEMKEGHFPDKPKVTGCLSTRCVLQEVLKEALTAKKEWELTGKSSYFNQFKILILQIWCLNHTYI